MLEISNPGFEARWVRVNVILDGNRKIGDSSRHYSIPISDCPSNRVHNRRADLKPGFGARAFLTGKQADQEPSHEPHWQSSFEIPSSPRPSAKNALSIFEFPQAPNTIRKSAAL